MHVMGIILHDTEGPLDAAVAWFQNAASGVSAHYLVGKDGRIIQMVLDKHHAYHAKGTLQMLPTWMTAMPKPPVMSRPNAYTVGIELELLATDPDGAYTDVQYQRCDWLIERLCQKYRIPRNRRRILGHGEIQTDRSDPRGLAWERLRL